MFGEKKPGKMYNVYWYRSYTQTFLFCFFIFTSFNATSLILLVKHILLRYCKSVKALLIQVGWANTCVQVAGVNALAQNKFRSTIHLLNQHLLAYSHQ